MFRDEGFATFSTTERVFNSRLARDRRAAMVRLDRMERQLLVTLYNIEESMVGAIKGLYKRSFGQEWIPRRSKRSWRTSAAP